MLTISSPGISHRRSTRDAQNIERILKTILQAGGTAPRAFHAYNNGRTYASQNDSPDIRRALYVQVTTVTLLYRVINRLTSAQTTVLNRGAVPSLELDLQAVTALNDYLTVNTGILDTLRSGQLVSSSTAVAASLYLRSANNALKNSSLTDRIPSKEDLKGKKKNIDISSLSFPPLSSLVSHMFNLKQQLPAHQSPHPRNSH